jgi:hypothetical protein
VRVVTSNPKQDPLQSTFQPSFSIRSRRRNKPLRTPSRGKRTVPRVPTRFNTHKGRARRKRQPLRSNAPIETGPANTHPRDTTSHAGAVPNWVLASGTDRADEWI